MKKIIAFAEVCLYILALIGGVGYLLLFHKYAIGAAIVVLAAMAFPELKKAINELTSFE